MVAGCGFSGSSKQLLGRFCEALQASMAPRRSPISDWTCFPLYLSMAVWNLLQHTQGQLQKIDGLADYLICELGLRNPSEMTMATVAALLSMHDPNGQAVRSSAQQMYALLQTCRSRFKSVMARARAASREVVAYVQQLPSDTSRLPAQLVQARFPHGFSPAQVDLQELSRHARAWPLRETNNLVRGQGTQQAAATGSNALSLLQQAATVFRAMGLGPRSPRVPVEPTITYLPSTAAGSQLQPQRTDLSRCWHPLQVLPAHCLCSCQHKASSRSKALRSSCRHRCLSRRRRTPLKVKQQCVQPTLRFGDLPRNRKLQSPSPRERTRAACRRSPTGPACQPAAKTCCRLQLLHGPSCRAVAWRRPWKGWLPRTMAESCILTRRRWQPRSPAQRLQL